MIQQRVSKYIKMSLAQREELAPNAEDALEANHDEAEHEHSLTEHCTHIHSTQQNMMTQQRISKYVIMSLEHEESSHQMPSMHTTSNFTIKIVMKMPRMISEQPPAFYCLMSLICVDVVLLLLSLLSLLPLLQAVWLLLSVCDRCFISSTDSALFVLFF